MAAPTAEQIAASVSTAPTSVVAEIDEAEHISPLKSFKLKRFGSGSIPVIKKFTLPEQVPYDVSSANFSIVPKSAQMERSRDRAESGRGEAGTRKISRKNSVDEASRMQKSLKGNRAGSSRTPTVTKPKRGNSGSGGTLRTLSASPVGNFYLYSFDGRLLSEYDIYGACLKDYVYMGNRLVAEYNPATSQYFYYTQDQIGSTRIVTNDSGAVVYAEAHDPYGGVQKTWPGNTFDPKRKFSDKERDEETSLDYFAARYYANSSYRWLSVDPVLITERAIARPQA